MSGCRSAVCAALRKHYHDIFLTLLLSICLTQAAWVVIYDCTAIRSIFDNESSGKTMGLSVNEWGSITAPISHAAKAAMALVSGLVTALVFRDYKKILKSLQTLSWVACSCLISGVIIMDVASELPVDEAAQLAIGAAAIAVYVGFTVLAFLTKHLPPRAHQLFVSPSSTSLVCPEARHGACWLRSLSEKRSSFSGHLAHGWRHSCRSTVPMLARPARRLAAGRDHQLPRECGKNILPIRRQLHDIGSSSDEDDGDESEREVEPEEAKGWYELGFGIIVYISVLVGSSMAVGVVPAAATTVGAVIGVAYVMCTPIEEGLPATAISIGGGVAGHAIGLAAMAAINYALAKLSDPPDDLPYFFPTVTPSCPA
ncbi:hypothetical protein PRIPAC_92588 [Pristionchus pacificus]|uniref:Uncharacterized protein n=1 Tax=Pristionchus pacificus TaxID=54126 RepID=A0A2A6BII2_PRIPA|nr:hypothetical protein PRIPAC_92588 [Pristionchus pacificus]|eukprot:PDM65663.1 hypothetical protein PRIPAC_45577 [Pristionchus pacificus]